MTEPDFTVRAVLLLLIANLPLACSKGGQSEAERPLGRPENEAHPPAMVEPVSANAVKPTTGLEPIGGATPTPLIEADSSVALVAVPVATTPSDAGDLCATIQADALRVLTQALGAKGVPSEIALTSLAPFGTCLEADARGRWALTLESVDVLDYDVLGDDGEWSGVMAYSVATTGRPAFITNVITNYDRAVISARTELDGTGRLIELPDPSRTYVNVILDDWTGDGESDLVVLNWRDVGAFTFDGAVKYVDMSWVIEQVTEVSDLDGDGRLDLLDFAFFTFDFIGVDATVETLALIAHATPDGRFTRDDEFTRRYYREKCHDLGKPPWRKGRYDEDALKNIACARLFGVGAKTILNGFAREVSNRETDSLLSHENFKTFVERTPPLIMKR